MVIQPHGKAVLTATARAREATGVMSAGPARCLAVRRADFQGCPCRGPSTREIPCPLHSGRPQPGDPQGAQGPLFWGHLLSSDTGGNPGCATNGPMPVTMSEASPRNKKSLSERMSYFTELPKKVTTWEFTASQQRPAPQRPVQV